MHIKNKVKYSFLLITILILMIFIANSVILYQINENEESKKNITKLILLQENMTSLTKDIIISQNEDRLKQIETRFTNYEKEFETLHYMLINDTQKDFIDYVLKDMHQEKSVLNQLNILATNEKQIETSFETLFELQREKIKLNDEFIEAYPLENRLRNNLEEFILEKKDFNLLKNFSDIKYYSKEVLFQKKSMQYLNKWLDKVNALSVFLKNKDLESYKTVIKQLGENAINSKKLQLKQQSVQDTIYNSLKQNKNINEKIQNDIDLLSKEFLTTIRSFITLILFFTLAFIIYLSIKVNKNVALTVDEIEEKVQKGLKKIKKLNHEIEDTQKEVIFTMGAIGESRSKETGNHVKRVAEYSKLFALYYGLDEKEAEMLKMASPMHDIGKVAIPDAILNKPGRFDDNEREIMNTHAQLGYEMLKHSKRPLLKMAATISKEHHEKWDGSGYPKGLKEEEINIYGRITAIADVFDALGSDRCYKKAWDDERIFKLFKEERGKHFDPKLVDIFFKNLDEFLAIREKFKDTI